MLAVGDDEQSLQLLEHPVPPPLLGEFHRRPEQIAPAVGEMGLHLVEEGEGVRHGACKAGDDAAVVEPAHLSRGILHDDRIAHGDLPVAGHRGMAVLLHGQNGCRCKHGTSCRRTGRTETPTGRFPFIISWGCRSGSAAKKTGSAPAFSFYSSVFPRKASSAARARRAIFSFFSFLGTRFSSGGMRPKLTFMGWKFLPS